MSVTLMPSHMQAATNTAAPKTPSKASPVSALILWRASTMQILYSYRTHREMISVVQLQVADAK